MALAEIRDMDDRCEAPPLTPPHCDLRDFPAIMINIPRLRGSAFDATTDDAAWRAGFNLWMTAWHQVPAASLDGDEASLTKAAGLGRDVKTWRQISATALHGWRLCSDGRLYHAVVAETALEAWIEKQGQRLSSGAGNAKRHGSAFDPEPIFADLRLAVGLLTNLNPRSKALTKQHVRKALNQLPPGIPPGPKNLPPGQELFPPGPKNDPTGVPPGSQEKGREGNLGSEDKSSGAEGAVPDFDKEAWDGAVQVLRSRGDMADKAARAFFGKLLAVNRVEARDLLPAIASAKVNGTAEPQSYLTKAAQGVTRRRTDSAPRRVGFV